MSVAVAVRDGATVVGGLLVGEAVKVGVGDAVGVRVIVGVGVLSTAAASSVLEGVKVVGRRVALETAVLVLVMSC